MTKIIFRSTKNIKHWIWQHYDNIVQNGPHEVVVDDSICELLRNDLDTLCDVIMAAKKVIYIYIREYILNYTGIISSKRKILQNMKISFQSTTFVKLNSIK